MTAETAQAIVDGVAKNHPKLEPIDVHCFGTYSSVTFKPIDIDPRTVIKWFESEKVVVPFQIGYNIAKDEMYLYFREV